MKVVLLSLFAGLLALGADTPKPASGPPIVIDQIVAKVNGDIVSQDELDRLVRERVAEAKAQGASGLELQRAQADMERNLLRDRIDQLLLVQKGKELNITVDSEISKYMASLRRQSGITDEEKFRDYVREKSGMTFEDFQAEAKNSALTREVISSEVGRHIHVSDKEVEDYYNAHQKDFIRDEKVYLSEILISTQGKDAAGTAAAEKKANQIYDDLNKGSRFPDLARDNSDATTAKDGGSLGGYKKGELNKEIDSAVWNLPKGSITKPMKVANGYEIFKVDDHTKEGLAPMADVKGDIENALYGPKMQPRIREYLTQLRAQAFLQIKPGFIDTGAAPGMDTKWQDPAVLKPETVLKAQVEQKTRMKRLLWTIPVPGTAVDVTGKSSSR
jgi:parvulin-like peptidyl-prolyl isomerase